MDAEAKELRGDSHFPEDVATAKTVIAPIEKPIFKPRNLTPYEMSSYAGGPGLPTFGMDRILVAKFFRQMADCFETGEYSAIQESSMLRRVEHGDYAMTYFTIVFHERTEMTPEQIAKAKEENAKRGM
jgi:hypothetical protein